MTSCGSGLHHYTLPSGACARRWTSSTLPLRGALPARNLSCCVGALVKFAFPSAGSMHAKSRAPVVRCHTETQVVESIDRAACPPVKTEIDHSAFSAVDLRVGLITDAKLVIDPDLSAKRGKPTDSRRYLQLIVDIGCETRTVVSECRYVMDVEDAVGKKVLVVVNVPPAQILGVKSHGLVLTGFNYDPTPMPRSFKVILPGLGRLPPGSQMAEATVPK